MAANAGDDGVVFEIASVDHALAAIAVIINEDIDPSEVTLNFENADWASFGIKYNGTIYKQTVTPTIMQGLVDYQFSIYRSIGLIIRDKQNVSSLTDEEKALFELVFHVKMGSSDLAAKADGILQSLVERSFGKMNGKETLICILTLAAFGLSGWGAYAYLNNVVEVKKIEAQSERESGLHKIITKMNDSETERLKIIAQIKNSSPKAELVIKEITDGIDSVIKHSQNADSIEIQGIVIEKDTIREITAIRRRQSEIITLKSDFFIDGTDATDERGFIVKLRDSKDERVINATLFDPLLEEKYLPALQRAEAKKTKVFVQLNGKKLGDKIVDAKIVKVTVRRASKN